MVFGNPVRELPSLENLPRPQEFREGTKNILIVGGSQGARGINLKMEEALPEIAKRSDVSVVWQVGAKNEETIRQSVRIPENVTVKAFLDNIYAYLGHADLIVSRHHRLYITVQQVADGIHGIHIRGIANCNGDNAVFL